LIARSPPDGEQSPQKFLFLLMGACKIFFLLRKQFLRALFSCLSRNEPLSTPDAPSAFARASADRSERKAGGQKFFPPDPFLFARLLENLRDFFGRRRD
jgi:hypothetical protein